MKIYNTQVVLREFPGEITLALNITGCPIHCPECHTKDLWKDIGDELTRKSFKKLLDENPGITCVGFMGGDANPMEIIPFSHIARSRGLKVGWYSGREGFEDAMLRHVDYYKLGPYDSQYGPLDNPATNQRYYYIVRMASGRYRPYDRTYLFQNKMAL